MIRVAKYYSASDVGKMLGWPTRRAKRWLKRHKAGVKKGRYWYTTDLLLREHFPEAFREAAIGDDH